jgi:archaellum component FlaC
MSLPNDPTSRKAIMQCMEEISNSMSRIEGERDFIKEAIINICEKYELNKKTFRKLAKTYHKQNFSKEVMEHKEYEDMYQQLTNETVLDGTI